MVRYDVLTMPDEAVSDDAGMKTHMDTHSGSEEQVVLTRAARRSARTTRKLLNAATDVFLDRGLAGATIEEITERADLGKGTFYIYFSSKTAVFESLVGATMKRLLSRIRGAVKDASGLHETLDRLVEAELTYHQTDPRGFRLIALARTLLQLNEVELPECAAAFEKYFYLVEKAITRNLTRPVSAGQLRRIAILLTNVSSGYLSFEAFEVSSGDMLMAYAPVRNAVIGAVVDIIEKRMEHASDRAEADPPAAGAHL